jgi:hypothetical protein
MNNFFNMEDKLGKYIEDHILSRLRNNYRNRYEIERGRGDRIMVDGKVIKGILFDPTRQKTYQGVEAHIEFIISLIDEDIKKGRFIGLTE